MKVLDLQCAQQHVFEGWFGSEDDFSSQLQRRLIECPVCGDADINKRLSAPRLNLNHARGESPLLPVAREPVAVDASLQAAWMALSRQIMAQTDDVGARFAEESRKMHYGETPERAIRGQATRAETESLLDEGIAVLPLLLPDAFKGTLQ